MVEQVVGLRFVVDGEAEATQSLKRFNAANEAAGSGILKIASKVSGAQAEWLRLNNLFERNVIGISALSSAQEKLASQIARLTGVTRDQARDSLLLTSASERAAAAAKAQAEAALRAAEAEKRRIVSIKELEGSILRQGQSVQTAVNRLKELDALQAKGAVSAARMAQGQLEIARALAAANGYLTANGALNTRRAQAEILAAQTAQRLADATRAQAAADAAAAANKTRLTQSYNQLLASINPVIAAQQKTKQTIDMLRAAVAAGAITTTQAAQALLQYRAALRSLNAANQQTALGLNRTGVITQQAGYQVGDFIVQIQSGTNAMVALGQQATQLIGTFAAFATTTRSIMILSGLGVLVPILTAIGAAMMRTSGASDTLTQKLDKLRDSSDKVAETLDLLGDNDLSEKFGNMTDEVQRLSAAMLALDDAAALRNLLGALDKLEEKADAGFWQRLSPLGFGAGLAAMFSGQEALDLVNEEAFRKLGFQMSRETYKSYIDGLKIAADAGDRQAVVGLFEQFIEDATDAGTAASKVSAEGYIIADSMRQSALAVAELVARLNGSADAAKRLAEEAEREAEIRRAAEERSLGAIRFRAESAIAAAEAAVAAEEEARAVADKRGLDAIRLRAERAIAAAEEVAAAEAEALKIQLELASKITAEENLRNQRHASRIQDLQNEIRVSQLALQYGRDSVEVQTELNRQARARVVTEMMAAGHTAESIVAYLALVKKAQELEGNLAAAEEAAKALSEVDMDKGIAAAAGTAAKLAKELGVSLGIASRILALGGGREEAVIFDPRDPRYDPIKAEMARLSESAGSVSPFDPSQQPRDVADGGTGAVDEFTSRILSGELLEAIRLAQEETALYGREVQMLDSALQNGLITQLEYNSYVEQAREAYGQASQGASDYQKTLGDLANFSANEMSSAFMSIVDGSKSASDAFKDMARAIIKQAFQLAVINPIINSIFGGVSGYNPLPTINLFSANGNAFIGGNVTAFANGGVVGGPTMFPMSGGRTGLMGEAGPEAIMPLKRTSSGKLGVVAEGGGGVVVNQTINVDGGANPAAIRQEMMKMMPQFTAATTAAVIDARRRGGQMKAAFS